MFSVECIHSGKFFLTLSFSFSFFFSLFFWVVVKVLRIFTEGNSYNAVPFLYH